MGTVLDAPGGERVIGNEPVTDELAMDVATTVAIEVAVIGFGAV
jgi:hypothetical protein